MVHTVAPALYPIMFSSELSVLKLYGTDTIPLRLTVVTPEGVELFSNVYTPDSEGTVTVYDLDKVITSDLRAVSPQIVLKAGDSRLGPEVIKVLRCSAVVEALAFDFLEKHFLTPSDADRDTALGRYEKLSGYSVDKSVRVTATASFLTPEGKVVTDGPIDIDGFNGGPIEVDVSPMLFVKDMRGRLLSYEVRCGKRVARYRVLDLPEADPAVVYLNCFGCWETFYFTGKKELTPSYTRSQARIGGKLRSYEIEEELSFKAMTGPLRQGAEDRVMDLVRSREVYLLNSDGSTGEELVVTDCDVKHSNDPSELPDLTVTFRYASTISGRVKVTPKPRVFDNSFDETYE